ncbi:hypothetical protein KNO15_11195 [Leifsonia shinshuensis]|uniref:hypothetical protein n=1 Tax=Leifsonia shinshuensis TaxID=150026 RepID=UPI001F51103B|nr:hypothetical protein [Leifsonia shinshuensis]MCI0157261.1 hypothetical protein [Leifsonia shinshuensis]
MSHITRADREGAQRYTQLVAGTPLDDRGEVELEAFTRLSTRELDALVADLLAGEREEPDAGRGSGTLGRFLRGELGFAAALLGTFALIAVLVVGAAALSNGGAATTSPPGQTVGSTTTGHSASTSVRPGAITDGFGTDW